MSQTSMGMVLLAAVLGGGLGGAVAVVLGRPAAGEPVPLGAVEAPAAAPAEVPPPAAEDARLAEMGRRLAGLEQQLDGLRQLTLQRGDGGIAAAKGLASRPPLAPVTESEVQRFLEIERTVARYRGVSERQERALSSVGRILGEAKVAAEVRAQVDPLLRGYLADEKQLLLVDRNALEESGRQVLEAQHKRLRDSLLVQLERRLEAPVAAAVVDQLAQGGPAGRSFRRGGDGTRTLSAGDIEIPPGIGPFPGTR